MICQLLNNKQTPYVQLIKRGKILFFTILWFPSINFKDKSPSYSKAILTKNIFKPNYLEFVHI